MNFFYLNLITLLVLQSCATGSYAVKIIKDPRNSGKSKFGPIDHSKDRAGLIWYYNQAFDDSRRELCYENMHEMCNGKYKILQEGESLTGDGATFIPNGGYMGMSSSITKYYFYFTCVD